MVQNVYLFDVTTTVAAEPACGFHVAVQLTNELGSAPRAGTRLLIDRGHSAANPELAAALAASDQFLAANKGSGTLFGALLEASPSLSTPGLFEASIGMRGVGFGVGVANAGLSIIQVANKGMAMSPRWKFFAGPEADPIFAAPLTFAASILDVDTALTRANGYNPLCNV